MKESLKQKDKLSIEYNEGLLASLEKIHDDLESFYKYFREEYSKLLKDEESPQITRHDQGITPSS